MAIIDESQQLLPPLTFSQDVANAAKGHALDVNAKGHIGSDGSSMSQRLAKIGGNSFSYMAENTSSGKSGQNLTMDLVIDDGVNSRGHRTNIFHLK